MADTRIDYLLIGGGRTSANAAQAIREHDASGSIAIVAMEDRKPYDRPPLSKNFLEGKPANPEDVESKPDDFFEKFRVELLRGVSAQELDRENKLVTLSNGARYEYGKLLLATGASPIHLPVPGADRDNVFYLRTVDDSARIRDAAKRLRRVVCVGAGYIGAEVSAHLSGLGCQCAMIGREPGLWDRFLGPESSQWLRRTFEKHGIDVRLSAQVTEIADDGVKLASGETMPADMVVVGVGVRQNLGLARDSGLEIDDRHGVVTDASLRTADPNVWAAGDIAAYDDLHFAKRWHLEHYMNADWQGTHVGKNMATGGSEAFGKIPYFFSDLFDLHFVLRGDADGGKAAKVIGDLEGGEFIELHGYPNGDLAMGLAFTRDLDKQDRIGDKLEGLLLARAKVADVTDASF